MLGAGTPEPPKAGGWRHPPVETLPARAPGVKQAFYIEALRGFNSCLQRQVNEAVQITSSKVDIVINSKSEFHQAPIVWVTVATGLELEQGEEKEVARGSWRESEGPEAEESGEGGGP